MPRPCLRHLVVPSLEPHFSFGLVAAILVLILARPCALGLAAPMSIMVGVGCGAPVGALIRNTLRSIGKDQARHDPASAR